MRGWMNAIQSASFTRMKLSLRQTREDLEKMRKTPVNVIEYSSLGTINPLNSPNSVGNASNSASKPLKKAYTVTPDPNLYDMIDSYQTQKEEAVDQSYVDIIDLEGFSFFFFLSFFSFLFFLKSTSTPTTT